MCNFFWRTRVLITAKQSSKVVSDMKKWVQSREVSTCRSKLHLLNRKQWVDVSTVKWRVMHFNGNRTNHIMCSPEQLLANKMKSSRSMLANGLQGTRWSWMLAFLHWKQCLQCWDIVRFVSGGFHDYSLRKKRKFQCMNEASGRWKVNYIEDILLTLWRHYSCCRTVGHCWWCRFFFFLNFWQKIKTNKIKMYCH